MRSSKSRSRSKPNRPRSLGNIVNRVCDSSGPGGKVRGTPQQIIEKYQIHARDAQLSNDRIAAENFLQHAEHYTRLLAEAQRELAAEQEARQNQSSTNAQGNHNGANGAHRCDNAMENFSADNDKPRARTRYNAVSESTQPDDQTKVSRSHGITNFGTEDDIAAPLPDEEFGIQFVKESGVDHESNGQQVITPLSQTHDPKTGDAFDALELTPRKENKGTPKARSPRAPKAATKTPRRSSSKKTNSEDGVSRPSEDGQEAP